MSVKRISINPLPLMSKGEEKQSRDSIRQIEEEYCGGRILPSMPKGEIVGILSLMAKALATKEHLIRRTEEVSVKEQRQAEIE